MTRLDDIEARLRDSAHQEFREDHPISDLRYLLKVARAAEAIDRAHRDEVLTPDSGYWPALRAALEANA